MSNTYRPNTSGAGWRQREIEKAKARKEAEQKAKEEAEKKQYAKTETNFPSLIGAAPQTHVAFDQKFSTLAKNWQKSDDLETVMEAIEKEKDRKSRNEFAGVYIHRFREGRLAAAGEEEYEEISVSQPKPSKVDYEGWEEVKKKARKTPRELTEAELAKKYEDAGSDSDKEDEGMNSHLFDNRRNGELY